MKNRLEKRIDKSSKKYKRTDIVLTYFDVICAVTDAVMLVLILMSIPMFRFVGLLAGFLTLGATALLFTFGFTREKIRRHLHNKLMNLDTELEVLEDESAIDLEQCASYDQEIKDAKDHRARLIEEMTVINQALDNNSRLIRRLIIENEASNFKLSCLLDSGIANAIANNAKSDNVNEENTTNNF